MACNKEKLEFWLAEGGAAQEWEGDDFLGSKLGDYLNLYTGVFLGLYPPLQ